MRGLYRELYEDADEIQGRPYGSGTLADGDGDDGPRRVLYNGTKSGALTKPDDPEANALGLPGLFIGLGLVALTAALCRWTPWENKGHTPRIEVIDGNG